MKDRLAKAEDIIWRRIGDEIVVIKDDGRTTHVLNKTAALIWEMCSDTCTPDEIATSLCARFTVSLEEAIADVEDAFGKLKELGLLKQAKEVTNQ